MDKQHNDYFYLYPEEYNVLELLFKYSLEEVWHKKIYEGPANESLLQIFIDSKDIKYYDKIRPTGLYYCQTDKIFLYKMLPDFWEWFNLVKNSQIYLIKV